MKKKLKVHIGIPYGHAEGVTPQLYKSMEELKKAAPKFNWRLTDVALKGHFIGYSRSLIVAEADPSSPAVPVEYPGVSYDRVLMIDRDMSFTPEQARSLVESKESIIGAVYEMRGGQNKYSSAIKKFSKNGYVDRKDFYKMEETTGTKEVAGTGMGLFCMDRSVVEKMWKHYPWFPTMDVKYSNGGKEYWDCSGEDMGFSYYTAPNIGVPIKVNFDISVAHFPNETRRAGDDSQEQLKQAQRVQQQARLMQTALGQIESNLGMLKAAMPKEQQQQR